MSLKLYGYWRSSASYRVRIAMHLKQLAFEYIPVNLALDGGQQFQSEYKGLNPANLVPTYIDEDEDIILNQSMAIIEYIDEKYETGHQLIPNHKLDRARVRMVSQDLACDVQPIANLRVLKALASQFDASEEARSAWCRDWITKGFSALEKRLQTTAGEYCFGFDLSMADVCLVPQVYNAKRFGVDMDGFPIIQRINDNCNKLSEFVEAMPENQIDAVK